MTVLLRAPFLSVLAGLVVMLAFSEGAAFWRLPVLALLAALGTALVSYRTVLQGQRRVLALVLGVVFLSALWLVRQLPSPALPPQIRTTGTVVEVRSWGRFYAVAVKTPLGGFVLRLPFASLTEGTQVSLSGVPKPFRGASGGSDFREDRFWRARGMVAQLSSAKATPLPVQRWNVHRWRYGLYRALSIHLPFLTGAYLNAVWTGKRSEELNAGHRASGTAHLLAVSGFHVGLVVWGASFFLKRGKGRVLFLSLLLWGYVLLTGAPASAQRAALMLQLALLGELAGRPGSGINAVCLAAVLLLLRSPFWFWDVGWRLSVLAALVIAAVLERGAPGDWRVWLCVNPLVWLVTYPQVSRTFEVVPLAGLLVNVIAPPFFGFALSFASALAMLHFSGLPGTGPFLYAVEGAFALWGLIAAAVVAWVPWQIPWDPVLAYCCAVFLITLLSRALFVPWRNVAVLAPFLGLAAFAVFA